MALPDRRIDVDSRLERATLIDLRRHALLLLTENRRAVKRVVLVGASEQSEKSATEVFEMICVQQRIDCRVEMREDDAEVNHILVDEALSAECIDAVDGVEWKPADHEEGDDN